MPIEEINLQYIREMLESEKIQYLNIRSGRDTNGDFYAYIDGSTPDLTYDKTIIAGMRVRGYKVKITHNKPEDDPDGKGFIYFRAHLDQRIGAR
jgi:hypothetical protein